MKYGRANLDWSMGTWDSVDKAVHDEVVRVEIARKFMPVYMTTSDAKTVPADTVDTDDPTTLTVDEGAQVSIFEIAVGFALTQQQVSSEGEMSTATTLATRAANILGGAKDTLIFQGGRALEEDLFASGRVSHRNGSFGKGLLDLADETIPVHLSQDPGEPADSYGENTFAAVAEGYAKLQGKGQYGPYAIVFHTIPFAKAYEPLKTTLITPADAIKGLVTQWFYGSGTLDPFTGLLISLGGNTVDLAIGQDAITANMQQDTSGLSRFRVYTRFALRPKDPRAFIKFQFEELELLV
jgi:uncharacterized linocin/CFP29 family protein